MTVRHRHDRRVVNADLTRLAIRPCTLIRV